MKLPPVNSESFCVSDRATMSVEAPGAKATTKVTGLALGHSVCEAAGMQLSPAKRTIEQILRTREIGSMMQNSGGGFRVL